MEKNEKIVTEQVAFLLKDLGFDLETNHYYYVSDEGLTLSKKAELGNWNFYDTLYSAPSINDVNDWLYEKYNVHFSLIPNFYNYNNFKKVFDLKEFVWSIDITLIDQCNTWSIGEYFKTKKEAYIEAYVDILNRLIKSKKSKK